MAELTPKQAAERAASVELDKLCALMWEAMRAADPQVHLPSWDDLECYGDDIELPDGPGTIMLITAAARAIRAERNGLAAEQPSDAGIMAHHGRACTAVGEVRAAIAMLNGQAATEAEAIDLIESSIARFDKDGGR